MKKTILNRLKPALCALFAFCVTLPLFGAGGASGDIILGLKENETGSTAALIQAAEKEGLPIGVLFDKIKEGKARNASEEAIFKVVNKKYKYLHNAGALIRKTEKQGLKIKDWSYAVQVISELLEKGLAEAEYEEVAGICLRCKLTDKEVLMSIEAVTALKEEKFSFNFAKQILTVLAEKNRIKEQFERVSRMAIKAQRSGAGQEDIKEMLLDGINNGLNIGFIEKNIGELGRLKPEIRGIDGSGEKGENKEELIRKSIDADRGIKNEKNRKK